MKSFKGKNCYWASSTDLKIESLDEELRNANDLLAAKRAGVLKFTEDEMANLFPLAATTSKLLKKGMTLTEVRSTGVGMSLNTTIFGSGFTSQKLFGSLQLPKLYLNFSHLNKTTVR